MIKSDTAKVGDLYFWDPSYEERYVVLIKLTNIDKSGGTTTLTRKMSWATVMSILQIFPKLKFGKRKELLTPWKELYSLRSKIFTNELKVLTSSQKIMAYLFNAIFRN